MGKFGSQFFKKSPIKEVAKGRASRLRKRAQRRSERSGETGGYDYSDMKVLKLLGKAKRIEDTNFIKDLGFKEGSKRKGSMYGEDPRIQASFERPDVDDSSPLQGAYTSGADGMVYVSNRDAFQDLQDKITEGFNKIIEAEKDPNLQKEKQQRREVRQKDRQKNVQERLDKVKEDLKDKSKSTEEIEKLQKTKKLLDTRVTNLGKRITRRGEKIKSLEALIDQRRKDKRSRNFLTAAEKTEIARQHYLDSGEGTKDEWDALVKVNGHLNYIKNFRETYGFN